MTETNSNSSQKRQQLVGVGSGCYEMVETADDSLGGLVTRSIRRQRCCCGTGWIVAGLMTTTFVFGCLLSFAVTSLVMRSTGTRRNDGASSGGYSRQRLGESLWISEAVMKENRKQLRELVPSSAFLEQHVAALTRNQSRAGTPSSAYHANYVADNWRRLGLRVFNRTYTVLLSYLDTSSASGIEIGVQLCRRVVPPGCKKLNLDEAITAQEKSSDALPSIVPFTKPLVGEFQLITLEQLIQAVVAKTNPNQLRQFLSNKIILGDRPVSAFINITVLDMTSGVLKKMSFDSQPGVPIYPNGTGVPKTTISMRPTLNTNVKGDPATPLFPSKPYAVRLEGDPPLNQPDHPTVPISEADVEMIMREYGDGSCDDCYLRVNWPMRTALQPIQDVCAELPGWLEPDRVVLVAGHRDAWHSGALDPHSGQSSLLEIGRALMDLYKTGWRPRRSLLLCSWDAEEWNLIGSAEWLDEEIQRANRRIVGYVNTDTDIMGNWKVMVHAFRRWHGFLDGLFSEVPNPDQSNSDYHFYVTPDAYSDYYVFWRNLGIPIVDLSYIRPNEPRMVVYDLYHSRYDTLQLYRLTDPGGKAHLATVHNYLGIVYSLLDAPILPGNMTDYAAEISEVMGRLYYLAENASVTLARGSRSSINSPAWSALRHAFMQELDGAASALRHFQAEWLDRVNSSLDILSQRMLNDKLMEVQKAFVYRSTYPHPDVVNLLAEEGSLRVFRRIFRQEMHDTHELRGFSGGGGGGGGSSEARQKNLEKLLEVCILSLASVSKLLSDSFAT